MAFSECMKYELRTSFLTLVLTIVLMVFFRFLDIFLAIYCQLFHQVLGEFLGEFWVSSLVSFLARFLLSFLQLWAGFGRKYLQSLFLFWISVRQAAHRQSLLFSMHFDMLSCQANFEYVMSIAIDSFRH